MMFGSRRLAEAETRGGIDPRYKQGALPSLPRCEVRVHLSWIRRAGLQWVA
jgi:hypothetical protein